MDLKAQWFERWGVTEQWHPSDDPVLGVKVFEDDILDENISHGARILLLLIRFKACFHDLNACTKSELAVDLKVSNATITKWLTELIEHHKLNAFLNYPLFHSLKGKVYFVQSVSGGPIKIGCAVDPLSRLETLQTSYPGPLRLLAVTDGGYRLERQLHEQFSQYRIHGEWFLSSPELLEYIQSLN